MTLGTQVDGPSGAGGIVDGLALKVEIRDLAGSILLRPVGTGWIIGAYPVKIAGPADLAIGSRYQERDEMPVWVLVPGSDVLLRFQRPRKCHWSGTHKNQPIQLSSCDHIIRVQPCPRSYEVRLMSPAGDSIRVCRNVAGVVIAIVIGLILVGHEISAAILSRSEAINLRLYCFAPLGNPPAARNSYIRRSENAAAPLHRWLWLPDS